MNRRRAHTPADPPPNPNTWHRVSDQHAYDQIRATSLDERAPLDRAANPQTAMV